ncbi:MAG: transglutaminase-like domain-containing protein, partial [Cellulomonas sp.]
ASVPTWTAAQLAAAGRIADVPVESLTVPQTSKTSAVRLVAQRVTAGATTPYEQAVALQNYFRDSRNFTYDTTVAPVVSDDAVWDFLQGKRGYCVHFATAMTVMARMLGIPARIAVGFLPGQANGTTYTVTGRQTHAWPELYFAGAGWVRFEPTPAVQTGLAPAWTSPATASGPTPSPSATSENPHPTSSSVPTIASTAGSAGTTGSTDSWAPGWPWGGGAAAVVVGAALGFLGLRRRRRGANLGPEEAWATLRKQTSAWGVQWNDASTPRAVVAAVTRRMHDAGADLTREEQAALRALAAAVEDLRYAPDPSEPTSSELRRQVTVVTAAVARAVSGRPARAGDPNALPSGS